MVVEYLLKVWSTKRFGDIRRKLSRIRKDLENLVQGLCMKGSVFVATEKKHRWAEITYATIINGFCKVGKTGVVLKHLKKMDDDKRIKPFVGCFNPIIDGHCKGGGMDEVLSLFQDMINLGIVPDVVTYTSLVHGLCEFGRWEEAKR
ncbi:Pentatricopeptide repeat [Trema orientale]|uniref:Pentatricopeptide repeat n=1 Tax=Trema orientale TaxID=63057 RepID=A0A2P5ERD3_TREOI|nr:Pentatricopeptide repeat [Trema orientale]